VAAGCGCVRMTKPGIVAPKRVGGIKGCSGDRFSGRQDRVGLKWRTAKSGGATEERKTGKAAKLVASQMHELDLPGSFEEVEAGEADREREAAGAGAAGVDVEEAVLPVSFGLVSVPTDDDLKAGGGIEVQVLEIVEDVDRDVEKFDDFGDREAGGPGFGVHVTANCKDGRDGFQLIKNRWLADVAGVNDGVGAP
jgi:hypothetical protein